MFHLCGLRSLVFVFDPTCVPLDRRTARNRPGSAAPPLSRHQNTHPPRPRPAVVDGAYQLAALVGFIALVRNSRTYAQNCDIASRLCGTVRLQTCAQAALGSTGPLSSVVTNFARNTAVCRVVRPSSNWSKSPSVNLSSVKVNFMVTPSPRQEPRLGLRTRRPRSNSEPAAFRSQCRCRSVRQSFGSYPICRPTQQ